MTVHIKNDESLSWCGQPLEAGFHFASVETAVYNGKHADASTSRACAVCTNIIITHLINGREDETT